jgi:Asp/Glu/hydantoin racemase
MRILNLTQHLMTPEQQNDGVYEPKNKTAVQSLLTFHSAPTKTEMIERAKALAEIARKENAEAVMLGGAPYFMGTLENVISVVLSIPTLYSFSVRESVEIMQFDGSMKKTSVFKHVGWAPKQP